MLQANDVTYRVWRPYFVVFEEKLEYLAYLLSHLFG